MEAQEQDRAGWRQVQQGTTSAFGKASGAGAALCSEAAVNAMVTTHLPQDAAGVIKLKGCFIQTPRVAGSLRARDLLPVQSRCDSYEATQALSRVTATCTDATELQLLYRAPCWPTCHDILSRRVAGHEDTGQALCCLQQLLQVAAAVDAGPVCQQHIIAAGTRQAGQRLGSTAALRHLQQQGRTSRVQSGDSSLNQWKEAVEKSCEVSELRAGAIQLGGGPCCWLRAAQINTLGTTLQLLC